MAVARARIEPVRIRRFDPAALRGRPLERRAHLPRRALVVGVILAGGWVQHVLATTPAEPQPTPLAVAAAAAAPPAAPALRSATRAHGKAIAAEPSPRRHPFARPGRAVAHHATGRVSAVSVHRPRPVRAGHRRRVVVARPPERGSARVPLRRARPPHSSRLLPPVGAAGDALRAALAPNPQGAIRHVPSVSVAAIRAALQQAG